MKRLLLLSLVPGSLFAKPLVMVSYYDAFGKATSNNSERVAKALFTRLSSADSPVRIKLCPLETKFDTAYAQLEKCVQNGERPEFLLGLGEANCNLKIELVGRNLDKNREPDNAGEVRNSTAIIPGADPYLGFTFPLAQMYCALSSEERNNLDVSNSAGSFVCNNTAFQLSHFYPELRSGFIHVPANNCRNLERKTAEAVNALEKMIIAGAHVESTERLPVNKEELQLLRSEWEKKDKCLYEFYKRAKGVDEKSFWGFSPSN